MSETWQVCSTSASATCGSQQTTSEWNTADVMYWELSHLLAQWLLLCYSLMASTSLHILTIMLQLYCCYAPTC